MKIALMEIFKNDIVTQLNTVQVKTIALEKYTS